MVPQPIQLTQAAGFGQSDKPDLRFPSDSP